ncbi:carbohydrate-binding family 9-like protein [Arcicella sp. DC2W]|uniref:Carbohydrate-binding family 9-like protein n=1 Tax=Arcicella gelida TaxID=2984195 RepID=A0ABU5S8K9_9BACT|nr:carbohydrate-binding family 9-like protein [Arcicella sp. DC2W]MEA5404812.1 carbohydrate-binding family 9-like protein [Arcicella sp. DC2W]
MKKLLLTGIIGLKLCTSFSQVITEPLQYHCFKTAESLKIDGKLSESSWQKAQWTSLFIDIEGDKKPKPLQATKAKMLWDDKYLYIAAELEEKHIWAYQNKKDQIVFLENDFEIFIDPDGDAHNYFELEVNAINNTFDLFLPKPYRDGGNALINWDIKKLKTAVNIEGTVNNATDTDKRWTVEIAIPFTSISLDNDVLKPQDLSYWRVNFSRVEWNHDVKAGKYSRQKNANGEGFLPEYNWVWSPQGKINMHMPENWGYLVFSDKKVGAEDFNFPLPNIEKVKQIAWDIYHKQKKYFAQNQHYAKDLTLLELDTSLFPNKEFIQNIELEATSQTFFISIVDKEGSNKITLNQDSLLKISKSKSL